jgi:hypothetical protein
MEEPAVPVRPIHHRCHAQAPWLELSIGGRFHVISY